MTRPEDTPPAAAPTASLAAANPADAEHRADPDDPADLAAGRGGIPAGNAGVVGRGTFARVARC
jgi:hypothetical protein